MRNFRSLRTPALALLTVLSMTATGAPANADGGLFDTMLQAAKDAPAKLYEGTGKTYRAGIMTPEALTACLILAHRIDAVTAGVEADKARIRDLDARIQDAGPRLQNQAVAALTDPELRKTYAARVSDYNAWVDARRGAVEEHNRQVRQFSEMSARFDGECNGRAYFPSDLEAIKSDLPPEVAERIK